MHGLGEGFTLRGAGILAGDSLDLLPAGDIEVRRGVISRIGPELADPMLPIIDVVGKLAIPGFVNGHTHFLDAAIKEAAYDSAPGTNLFFPPDGVRPRALSQRPNGAILEAMRRTARHMIATGTVAFADFTAGGVEGVQLLKGACDQLPLRTLSLGSLAKTPFQSQDVLDANHDGLTLDQIAELEEVLNHADGVAPVRAGDLTDAAMEDFHRVARAAGKLVATHAAVLPSYREISLERTGRSDIERIAEHLNPDFIVHMTDADEADLRCAVDSGIAIIMCARANATFRTGNPPYADAVALGATIGLGSDNVMLEAPDLVDELSYLSRMVRISAIAGQSVNAIDMLRSATISGAHALGIDDTLGSLRQGKSASMVLFDMQNDNLCYSLNPVASVVHRATRADIQAVIIDGVVASGSLP